jgi:hypothetical protein
MKLINITLGIHVLCSHIGCIFVTAVIWKLNFIIYCVQHWVCILSPPYGSIQLALAP